MCLIKGMQVFLLKKIRMGPQRFFMYILKTSQCEMKRTNDSHQSCHILSNQDLKIAYYIRALILKTCSVTGQRCPLNRHPPHGLGE